MKTYSFILFASLMVISVGGCNVKELSTESAEDSGGKIEQADSSNNESKTDAKTNEKSDASSLDAATETNEAEDSGGGTSPDPSDAGESNDLSDVMPEDADISSSEGSDQGTLDADETGTEDASEAEIGGSDVGDSGADIADSAEPDSECLKDDKDLTPEEKEALCKNYPCNITEEFCMDEKQKEQGLSFCLREKNTCVGCRYNGDCPKDFSCDRKNNKCIQGIIETPNISCKEDKDCTQNPEASQAMLWKCLIVEGRCVECLDDLYCPEASCNRETHQCYLPTPPECNPTCPQGDGWYCWDNGVETYCRQEGGYCEECDTQSDCRYVDSKCWAPAGVPAEVGGYCFKECTTDSDCDAFDKPNKPSTCHNGICLCGWM